MKTSTSGDSRCSLKVLILGGYGAMAQSTVPDLLASPGVERIGIAGRSAAKAKSFAAAQRDDRATAVPVDARDSAALMLELKRWDCVINSSWYDLNVPIMEAAIGAGIHYCDLGGLYHQTLRQLKLDARAKDAGVTCVLGIGSTPGTMNVMGMHGASKLDKVDKVLLRSSGAVVAGGEPGKFVPPYAIRTIFDEFSLDAPILRNGDRRAAEAEGSGTRCRHPALRPRGREGRESDDLALRGCHMAPQEVERRRGRRRHRRPALDRGPVDGERVDPAKGRHSARDCVRSVAILQGTFGSRPRDSGRRVRGRDAGLELTRAKRGPCGSPRFLRPCPQTRIHSAIEKAADINT